MFPLPFTFAFAVISAASLISKLQYKSTNMRIALYSVLGPMEQALLIITCLSFIQHSNNFALEALLITSLSIIALVNILAFIIQTKIMKQDKNFIKWYKNKQRSQDCSANKICFYCISWASILVGYKLKMVMFSRVFNLQVLKCQLQTKQKFKIFDLMSLIGLIPEVIGLYCCINIIANFDFALTHQLIFVDCIVILALNIAFSVLIVKKDHDFFEEEVNGVQINKVYNVGEECFQSGIGFQSSFSKQTLFLPQIIEQEEYIYTMESKRQNKIKELEQLPQQVIERQEQHQNQVSSSVEKMSQQNTDNASDAGEEPLAPGKGTIQNGLLVANIEQNGNIFEINEQFDKQESQNSKNDELMKEESVYIKAQLKSQVPIELTLTNHTSNFQFQYPIKQSSAELKNRQLIEHLMAKRPQEQPWRGERKAKVRTHTKLSEYLGNLGKDQKNKVSEVDNKKAAKYEYIGRVEKQQQTEKQINKQIEMHKQMPKQMDFLINQAQLIDSEASQRYQTEILVYHPKFQYSEPNKLISPSEQAKEDRIQKYHHAGHNNKLYTTLQDNQRDIYLYHRPQTSRTSPKKVVLGDQQHKASSMYKSTLLNVHLNENHAQNPIRNKSKERLKMTANHPIKPIHSSPHPLRSHTQIASLSQTRQQYDNSEKDYSQFLTVLRQEGDKRISNGDRLHHKTEGTKGSRNGLFKVEENQVKTRTLQQQYQSKIAQFYENNRKNQGQNSRIFKRTTVTSTLFPHKNTTDNLLCDETQFHKDQVPRKPIQVASKPSAKKRFNFMVNESHSIVQSTPNMARFVAKYSSLDRAKLCEQGKRRKVSIRRKSSLQRIYLQNLQKLIQTID